MVSFDLQKSICYISLKGACLFRVFTIAKVTKTLHDLSLMLNKVLSNIKICRDEKSPGFFMVTLHFLSWLSNIVGENIPCFFPV